LYNTTFEKQQQQVELKKKEK